MNKPHTYRHLDKDSELTLTLDMRSLAERVVNMNYGTHRLLSHIIDVRRERLAADIKEYESRGDHDVADLARREGDKLADGIEALLRLGLT